MCFACAYLSNRYGQTPELGLRAAADRLQTLVREAEAVGRQEADALAEDLAAGAISFQTLTGHTTYPTFVFRGEELLYWSDHTVRPEPEHASQPVREKLVEMRFGQFLLLRRPAGPYTIITYIPLELRYGISNRYLREGSEQALFWGMNVRLVAEGNTGHLPQVHSSSGSYLFSIESLQSDPVTGRYVPLLLLLLGIGFYILGWLHVARRLFRQGRVWHGALAIVLPLAGFRALLLYWSLPFSFIELRLFDPRVYAASWLSPSLGDLLLNAGLFVITATFTLRLFRRSGLLQQAGRVQGWRQRVVAGALPVLVFFGLLEMLFSFYSDSANNSQLVLDITQDIEVSSFKALLCLAIVLHTAGYLIGFYICSLLFTAIVRPSTRRVGLLLLLLGAGLFLGLGLILGQVHAILMGITLSFFLVLRFTGLKQIGAVLPYHVYLFLFLMLGVSSAVGALALYEYFNRQLLLNKQTMAGNLLVDNDLQGEYLLAERAREMAEDQTLRALLASPFVNQDIIRQKVAKYYLRGYFDKYEVVVTLFGPNGLAVGMPGNLVQMRNYLLRDAVPTENPAIYLLRGPNSFSSRRYVAFLPIPVPPLGTSHVVLELALKKLTANSVVPELLVDQKFFQPGLGTGLSYAGYENNQLVYTEGDFDYVNSLPTAWLSDPSLYAEGFSAGGFQHLGVRGSGKRVVIITTATYSVYDWLANFSFLFLLHAFALMVVLGAYALTQGRYRMLLQTNFSTKIQLFLNLGILVPMAVVSIATASQITSSYKRDLRRSYERRGRAVQENLLKNRLLLAESADRAALVDLAENVAALTETDLNLYNAKGELLVSSQPLIVESGLLSTLLNPQAVAALMEGRQPRVLLTEHAGTLSFNSLYLPLRAVAARPGQPGAVVGYVGIPFFDSKKDLNNKLTELISTTLNIFTVMFILFLVLAYLASKVLTGPLRLITEKLKQTTLTGQNEMLAYNSDDEIGLLVREYNHMLLKLEESKQELAMQEKEAAWREMARQVAHEIKNPLTPMKLSLQFLQKAIAERRDNAEELIGKISQTLITQIDVLSDIATSFSTFTNLPAMRPERLDVVPILRRCVGLHQDRTGGSGIQLKLPDDADTGRYVVYADENLLVRTFNNLLINALQAVPADRAPEIEVSLEAHGSDRLRICIQDNGCGIPAAVQDKVFVPNFTTKEHGSGIGLAVVRRGIESAGGTIWFETEVEKGTTFCIDLPLAG
ncbi:sensor histidine kinase [Hymenobacter weizhouensis]|uniref:sensor histidine kinase n=1 Tax=Hymenobacter sp. YIM 151500-1 TaxID=2987689 RepID=UPI002227CB83|nr:HAMP domain-containing sensor histidine kinase [Hymenobacter sp. YIM 151500-1]UYZ63326.1 HAMP domain-containing histidine kinase [Hymenobacter sp. YIM 151500-1]